MWQCTSDTGCITLGLSHHERRCLAVEGVRRVGIEQQLWEKHLKHVQEVEHGRPCLVDDVEAHGTRPTATGTSTGMVAKRQAVSGSTIALLPYPCGGARDAHLINIGVKHAVAESDRR